MKKYIIITIFAVEILLLNSCQTDVLDKMPLDQITDGLVWNDPDLMDAYLTQTYAQTYVFTQECADDDPWWMGDLWFGMFVVTDLSDEAKAAWWSDGMQGKYGNIRIQGGTLEWWELSYKVIRSLNEFIEKVPASSVETEFKKVRVAEARWIRAYNYFSMVKRYGGVPLITKVQSADDPQEELFPIRNSEKEIYDFIISELDAIATELPDVAKAEPGRASKGAALALKSRVALYAASIAQYGIIQLNGILGITKGEVEAYYKKSYDASKAIIESKAYSLYEGKANKIDNFRNIFLAEDNSEVIFAKKHNYNAKGSGGNGWAYDFFQCPSPQGWGGGNQDAVYLEMIEEFEYANGTAGTLDRNALQQGVWSTDELWANRDPRFYASIYTQNTVWKGTPVQFYLGLRRPDGRTILTGSYEGIPAKGDQHTTTSRMTGTAFGVLKYLEESKSNFEDRGTSGTDYLVFRYAEVLLNFAEAAFELSKPDEALDAINQIRRRAGVAELSVISRDKIRHERKVELAFEGHRYWDLRRWRTAHTDLTRGFSGLRYIYDFSTGKYQIKILNNVDGTVSPPLFHTYNYYLPITLIRTGNNPKLIENPGY